MGPILLIIVFFVVSFVCISYSFGKLFGFDLLGKIFGIFGHNNIIEKFIYVILGLLGIYLMMVGVFFLFY